MTKNERPLIDVAALTQGLYANAKFELGEVQPIHVLHRDTIRTFLHEKLSAFGKQGRLLGIFGIEISVVATLVTATFNEWHGISGAYIGATFFVCSVIFGVWCAVDFVVWCAGKTALDVDSLTDDLGARGVTIQPPKA
jgi:hypothetical protein